MDLLTFLDQKDCVRSNFDKNRMLWQYEKMSSILGRTVEGHVRLRTWFIIDISRTMRIRESGMSVSCGILSKFGWGTFGTLFLLYWTLKFLLSVENFIPSLEKIFLSFFVVFVLGVPTLLSFGDFSPGRARLSPRWKFFDRNWSKPFGVVFHFVPFWSLWPESLAVLFSGAGAVFGGFIRNKILDRQGEELFSTKRPNWRRRWIISVHWSWIFRGTGMNRCWVGETPVLARRSIVLSSWPTDQVWDENNILYLSKISIKRFRCCLFASQLFKMLMSISRSSCSIFSS